LTRCYLDTSAALKVLFEEPESSAFTRWSRESGVELVSSDLLETEVRRATLRRPAPQELTSEVLDGIVLHEITRGTFVEAGLLPGQMLRSRDALHLASALQIGVTAVATYDDRLAEAARAVGLEVISPA
jgi:uncharacterized protein